MSTFVPQVAKIVSMDVSKAYEELKKILREFKCKIVEEESPNKIVVEHGSAFAYSPMNAEKIVTFILTHVDSKTRIVAATQLTSDYKQFIILSKVFGFLAFLILYGVRFGVVDTLINLAKRLAGYVPPDIEAMVEMLNVLLFIAIAMIVIDTIWDIYIYWKRNSFAENVLKLLP
jgi:hypothetical protein